MNKTETKKKEKSESLLNTAFQLFTTHGFSNTSIANIAKNAGVAKGTFYLYFKDKYDIRNHLIAHKSSELFTNARIAMELDPKDYNSFEEKILFIANYVIDVLDKNKILLNFISKNLSWAIFKAAIQAPIEAENGEQSVYHAYMEMIKEDGHNYEAPEVMLFEIVELVSSCSYSSILYDQPLPIKKLKPFLYKTIRSIIHNHMIQ